jgi:nucleoside-diphosphate-sugar epimerase
LFEGKTIAIMKKYVVTGGAGFIGSALVRGLLALSDGSVEVIDNLSTGRRENLDEISSRITFHPTDIRDFDEIRPLILSADTVFHIAAIPSVPKSIVDPVPSHECNIDGTFNVLRACVDGGVRKVVYAASSSAYGDTEVLPKVETMQPNPKSPYAAQKLMGEYYCSAFSSCYGLDATSLRFFNVYGPRQDPGSPYSGVISVFMTCLLQHTSPTIHGDGEQTRDFTYIDDVVALILKAAQAPDVAGKVFNAGNGNRYSLNQVWDLLQKIEGIQIPALYGPPRAGDVRDSQADTTAAVRELGHAPRFTIEEGLRHTLEWYRESLVAADRR